MNLYTDKVEAKLKDIYANDNGYFNYQLERYKKILNKFKTSFGACKGNMERFTIELIDDRPALAFQDTRYVDLGGSLDEVCFQIYRQEQCLAQLRACGRKYCKQITQWPACAA